MSFEIKDYTDGAKKNTLTITALEFIRRFLFHVLPQRFVRIRHYGLLASRNVDTQLALARGLLGGELCIGTDRGEVHILPGDGEGGFPQDKATRRFVWPGVKAVRGADLDHDGRDEVVSSAQTPGFFVLRATGCSLAAQS